MHSSFTSFFLLVLVLKAAQLMNNNKTNGHVIVLHIIETERERDRQGVKVRKGQGRERLLQWAFPQGHTPPTS